MTEFRYSGRQEDGRTIQGTIDSPDIEAAKRKLEETGLEIDSIDVPTRSAVSAQHAQAMPPSEPQFAFEATDVSGTVHRGTIASSSKRSVFDALRSRELMPRMIAPVGVTPKYVDPDIATWLEKESPQKLSQQSVAVSAQPSTRGNTYFSLVDTGRLYSGWLVAWYGVFVALGYYVHVRALPWPVPFVEGFFVSNLIFHFIVVLFLFLALTTYRKNHTWMSLRKDLFLMIVGLLLYTGLMLLEKN